MTNTHTLANAETWLNAFVDSARPHFETLGYPLPLNLRCRMGLPSTGYRSNVIGECYPPSASEDGHWEIYINPRMSAKESAARIADIVTHELIHAAGITGHRKDFAAAASALGLQAPWGKTTASSDWFAWAGPILERLGPLDHGAMVNLRPAKVQPTWAIKVECPDCGWLARVSTKHITAHDYLNCPVPDCTGTLLAHWPDDKEEGE